MCSVKNADCSKSGGLKKGMCDTHYTRWRRHGDPNMVMRKRENHGLRNTRAYTSWQGMKSRCTNPSMRDGGTASWPSTRTWASGRKSMTIDRRDVNGNYSCGKCDECIAKGWTANCRWADQSTQISNQRKKRGTSSRFVGISWAKGKWHAEVWNAGGKRRSKYFDDEVEAARWRDSMVIELGLPAPLNFPRRRIVPRKPKAQYLDDRKGVA